MTTGWSINLSLVSTDPRTVFEVDFPVPPLWKGRYGDVMEVVFWSDRVQRWIHGVALSFERQLPTGHVQVTVGDLAWVRSMVLRRGVEGIVEVIHDLEEAAT